MIQLFSFLVGIVVGSFINVFIDRTIENKSLIYPPSACDNCHRKLKIYNLIPVLSYIFQRGRCSFCKSKIKIQYPIVEIVCGLIYLIVIYLIDNPLLGILLSTFLSLLLGMSIIDIKTRSIYTKHLIILFILSFPISLARYWIKFDLIIKTIFLIVIILLGYVLSIKNKAGFGDFILIAILTMNMYFNEISVFFINIGIIGLIIGITLIIKNKNIKYEIPFVPIISLSYFSTILLELLKIQI
ncbi:MAG: prepilin peptidase [Miniphocaeibacter sp.]|uniref:prepilin peptidase n=1 Tax=Miniphocaeibacter sp. TaxID=3100973 RepID=UPI0017DF9186|nr:prepilin peptidase [Gallicola sp.]